MSSVSAFYKSMISWCKYAHLQFFPQKCKSKALLTGKTVIITGGNTGIGKATAFDLAKRGAKVIIACRNMEKGIQAAHDIQEEIPDANVIVKNLDLASSSSIRKFCEDILETEPYIHILVNNAGITACKRSKTEDDFQMEFGVNHLGHFLLTTLLLDRIKSSAPARIITVSSALHTFGKIDFSNIDTDQGYTPFKAYCSSKLANVLFTRELAKKLQDTGVTTYSVHPGLVRTEIGRHKNSAPKFERYVFDAGMNTISLNVHMGAQTTIHCAVDESIASESSFYYSNCRKLKPSATARNDILAKDLWDVSEKLVSSTKRNEVVL